MSTRRPLFFSFFFNPIYIHYMVIIDDYSSVSLAVREGMDIPVINK